MCTLSQSRLHSVYELFKYLCAFIGNIDNSIICYFFSHMLCLSFSFSRVYVSICTCAPIVQAEISRTYTRVGNIQGTHLGFPSYYIRANRVLDHESLDKEVMLHWNAPLLHLTDTFIKSCLNNYLLQLKNKQWISFKK